jgi:hypothetical protein
MMTVKSIFWHDNSMFMQLASGQHLKELRYFISKIQQPLIFNPQHFFFTLGI